MVCLNVNIDYIDMCKIEPFPVSTGETFRILKNGVLYTLLCDAN